MADHWITTKARLATTPSDDESRRLGQGIAEATALLLRAEKALGSAMDDENLKAETPIEVQTAVELAAEGISDVIRLLKGLCSRESACQPSPHVRGGPTRQQGQFLAFIREYMMRNEAGIAPSHADLQRFFGLTPPSVNSMLVRLDQRGFIRRVPGKARAIELMVDPKLIPALDRPFTFY